ncbi:uncharacterized protein LOC103721388 isoform X2 [Phoenix dactylifera]|uniref:Uncharacterized protein LOC103721388 isoform X2 n=1 Tax=Phoenix dactylifera TaxID=42345 RepID=A0A8B7CZH0_PHODC|nr:uncharacterized protein LOC103721388 isoform X2 [Phoenix dactylifera]
MVVAFPCRRIWSPKAGISRSPLSVSTFSFTSFTFREIRGRGGRDRGIPRSSLQDSPSPSLGEPAEKKSNSRLPFDIGGLDGDGFVREGSEAKASSTGAEIFAPLSRRPMFRLRSKSFRRRPLWKRIFFASKKVRSIILLNVLAVIYASDIPVLKEVEVVMEPSLFTMVRFVLSAIPFLPFVLQARGDSNIRSAGIELGLWVSLGYLSQALGLLTSDAGRASFISAFTVIVVPLIDGMFGATVPAFIWSGAFASLVGVAMLECGGSPPCIGDALNILSAVFFGIHMLRTEQISRSTKKENFLELLGYEVCVMALSSVMWFLVRNIFGNVHDLNLGSCAWSMLWDYIISFPWIPAIYTGIFSTGLCLWAELDAMGDVSATEAAIIYGLEPVWGAAFAWFLLGERWGTTGWIGAALVLCGSLTVQILGSTTGKSRKVEDSSNSNHLGASDKQNNLSFSAVLINSRKNVADPFQKQDKL